MLDLKLNNQHELSLYEEHKDKHDFMFADGIERVAQQVKITLWTFWGEWFQDSRVGIPYQELILIKSPNHSILRSLFREAIMSIEGVTTVRQLRLSMNNEKRILNVRCLINSKYGLITFNDGLKV